MTLCNMTAHRAGRVDEQRKRQRKRAVNPALLLLTFCMLSAVCHWPRVLGAFSADLFDRDPGQSTRSAAGSPRAIGNGTDLGQQRQTLGPTRCAWHHANVARVSHCILLPGSKRHSCQAEWAHANDKSSRSRMANTGTLLTRRNQHLSWSDSGARENLYDTHDASASSKQHSNTKTTTLHDLEGWEATVDLNLSQFGPLNTTNGPHYACDTHPMKKTAHGHTLRCPAQAVNTWDNPGRALEHLHWPQTTSLSQLHTNHLLNQRHHTMGSSPSRVLGTSVPSETIEQVLNEGYDKDPHTRILINSHPIDANIAAVIKAGAGALDEDLTMPAEAEEGLFAGARFLNSDNGEATNQHYKPLSDGLGAMLLCVGGCPTRLLRASGPNAKAEHTWNIHLSAAGPTAPGRGRGREAAAGRSPDLQALSGSLGRELKQRGAIDVQVTRKQHGYGNTPNAIGGHLGEATRTIAGFAHSRNRPHGPALTRWPTYPQTHQQVTVGTPKEEAGGHSVTITAYGRDRTLAAAVLQLVGSRPASLFHQDNPLHGAVLNFRALHGNTITDGDTQVLVVMREVEGAEADYQTVNMLKRAGEATVRKLLSSKSRKGHRAAQHPSEKGWPGSTPPITQSNHHTAATLASTRPPQHSRPNAPPNSHRTADSNTTLNSPTLPARRQLTSSAARPPTMQLAHHDQTPVPPPLPTPPTGAQTLGDLRRRLLNYHGSILWSILSCSVRAYGKSAAEQQNLRQGHCPAPLFKYVVALNFNTGHQAKVLQLARHIMLGVRSETTVLMSALPFPPPAAELRAEDTHIVLLRNETFAAAVRPSELLQVLQALRTRVSEGAQIQPGIATSNNMPNRTNMRTPAPPHRNQPHELNTPTPSATTNRPIPSPPPLPASPHHTGS